MTSPIAVGTRTPEFRAPSSHGQTLDQDSFLGKVPVVLVFPSPDRTASLLRAFDDHLVEFGRRRIQVLVVLPATSRDVRDLADQDGISLPILADADGSIAAAFGADADRAFVTGADGILTAVLDVTEGPEVVLGHLDGQDAGGPGRGAGIQTTAGRTLDEEGVADLDGPLRSKAETGDPQEGAAPPDDRPRGSVEFGTTETEQLTGESLDSRIARENPDVERPAPELSPTLVGDDLLADDEKDLVATDVGTDPMLGMSAEEAAVHVVDEP